MGFSGWKIPIFPSEQIESAPFSSSSSQQKKEREINSTEMPDEEQT
jgi:hypothetical protein